MDSDSQYVVVARRYRPQSFEELIGQGMVAQALCNAIETNRVGHAYLFTGARGVGKTSAARILAKSLNCSSGPTTQPCHKCDICERVSSGDDVDVLEIDGASNRGIDEIRQLRSNANVRPSRARYKIYIIDEVHMLTREAFNALLKTLEEPPKHVKFIFCTTDPEKIPITVLSRCQRFDFPPVEAAAIADRLDQIVKAEGAVAERDALELLAQRAAGSMRDSQSLLEQLLAFGGQSVTVDRVHEMLGTARGGQIANLLQTLQCHDAGNALKALDDAIGGGADVGQIAEQLFGVFRDLMAVAVGSEAEMLRHSSRRDHAQLVETANDWGLETILASIQILDQAISRMRYSTQTRSLLEIALVRIARLEHFDELSSLIGKIEQDRAVLGPRAKDSTTSPATSAGSPSTTGVSRAPLKKKIAGELSHPSEGVESVRRVDDPSSPQPSSGQGRVIDLTETNVRHLWTQALDVVADTTADFARKCDNVATFGPNHLVVFFRARYNSSKLYCERPERRSRLEQAMGQVVGQSVNLEFRLLDDDVEETQEVPPQTSNISARQRVRDAYNHPLVQKAAEFFGAEVLRVEPSGREGR